MLRKVFSESLPKWNSGRNKGSINWEKSIGCEVEFIYNDITGFMLIIGLTKIKGKSNLGIKFKDKIFDIDASAFRNGAIGGILGVKTQIVTKGLNDVGTTNNELLKYFVNIEDSYTVCTNSHKKMLLKCPDCGHEKEMMMYTFSSNGFSCPNCNDGFSYPEKFMINLLRQLNINFKFQLSCTTLEWCNNYKYDFYIEDHNMIVETHGEQHYNASFFRCTGRTAEDEQLNDIEKEKLALENGINNYIIIDCRESSLGYIKNQILLSELATIYDLSNINWINCADNAEKSIMISICEYWNSNETTAKSVAELFNISRRTVTEYLNRGTIIGLCHYDGRKEQSKNCSKIKPETRVGKGTSFKSTNLITHEVLYYESIVDIKKLGYAVCNIYNCCNGKQKTYRGMIWEKVSKEIYFNIAIKES